MDSGIRVDAGSGPQADRRTAPAVERACVRGLSDAGIFTGDFAEVSNRVSNRIFTGDFAGVSNRAFTALLSKPAFHERAPAIHGR